jgi:hypothetical protein
MERRIQAGVPLSPTFSHNYTHIIAFPAKNQVLYPFWSHQNPFSHPTVLGGEI